MQKKIQKVLSVIMVAVMFLSASPITQITGNEVVSSIAVVAEAASKKIQLKKKKIKLTVGETYSQKLLDKNGKTIDGSKVTWKSKNKKVANVSKSGKVTAVKAGKTTITAKYKGKTYKFTITVKNAKLKYKSKTVSVGAVFTQVLTDANGKKIKDSSITWKSSDKNIAKISSKGKVTAKKKGKVKITATYKGKKYTCNLTVKKLSPVTVYDDSKVKISFVKAIPTFGGEQVEVYFKVKNKTSTDLNWILPGDISLNGYTFNEANCSDSVKSKSTETIICTIEDYQPNLIDLSDIEFISGEFSFHDYISTTNFNGHNVTFLNAKIDKKVTPKCPSVNGKVRLYSDANIDIYLGNIEKISDISKDGFEGNLIIRNKSQKTITVRDNPYSVNEYTSDYLIIADQKYESYVSKLSGTAGAMLSEANDKIDLEATALPYSVVYCEFKAYDDGRNINASTIKTIGGQICIVPSGSKEYNAYRAVFGTFTTLDPSV